MSFQFKCEKGANELKFIHNIPIGLVNPEALAAQRDGKYGSLFLATIQPILKEHEAACRAASKGLCENCGQPSLGSYRPLCLGSITRRIPLLLYWSIPYVGSGNAKPRCGRALKK